MAVALNTGVGHANFHKRWLGKTITTFTSVLGSLHLAVYFRICKTPQLAETNCKDYSRCTFIIWRSLEASGTIISSPLCMEMYLDDWFVHLEFQWEWYISLFMVQFFMFFFFPLLLQLLLGPNQDYIKYTEYGIITCN